MNLLLIVMLMIKNVKYVEYAGYTSDKLLIDSILGY